MPWEILILVLLAGAGAALTCGIVRRSWGWLLLAGFLAVGSAMLLPLESLAALVALFGLFAWAGAVIWRYRRGTGQLFDSALLAMPALFAYFYFAQIYAGWIRGQF